MKKLIFTLAATGLVILSNSCKKAALEFSEFETSSFTATVDLPKVNFPPNTTKRDTALTMYKSINVDSLIKDKTQNKFGADKLKTIRFSELIFTITGADTDNNFANFESLNGFGLSNATTTSYGFLSVSSPDSYRSNWDVTSFLTADVNLKELVKTDGPTKFLFLIKGTLRRATTKAVQLNMSIKFKVSGKLVG